MFTEVRPELMKVARRMLCNEVEAEDMVQEAVGKQPFEELNVGKTDLNLRIVLSAQLRMR